MGISAFYFDGKTSRRFNVEISVEGGIATVIGDIQRVESLADLRVSERGSHALRKVTFPDGAYLEVHDNKLFNSLLEKTGHRDSFVVRMQQSWRGTLAACVITLGLLTLGYLYGLPVASEVIAKALPEQVERTIGQETLGVLDRGMLAPSALSEERRNAIINRFKILAPPRPDVPTYQIVFRKSKIGPNAFALPSGQIVLTDEIVKLVNNDDAVMGILAHELGHLHERHLMRRIIQSSTVAAVTTVFFGDVSSIAANVPTLMLDMKYSRDAEREADDYAIAMLKANGISLSRLVHVFEKLGEQSEAEHKVPPYLSSHPSTQERIERIRDAQ
jgi:Zn-dependent protease with chaperone function